MQASELPSLTLRSGERVALIRPLPGGLLGDYKVLRADGAIMRIRADEVDDGRPQRASGFVVRQSAFRSACFMVARLHRHHRPPQGHKFSLAAYASGQFLPAAVAIVGRPIARHLDDGRTLEVTRLASDGTRNACSLLYSACAREARRRGYARIITYTLPNESGASLRAAGWRCEGVAGGGRWTRPGRPRQDAHPTGTKLRWCLSLQSCNDEAQLDPTTAPC